MTTLRIGDPHDREPRVDTLRDGALRVESPRGLGRAAAFLVEALPKDDPGRVLCGMDSAGIGALAARAIWPGSDVRWFHLDAYVARKVRDVLSQNGVDDVPAEALEGVPPGPFDLIALPFPSGGDSQLMWDLLEAAHDALSPGGRLVATTDAKPDALRKAVKKVFRNVTPGSIGRRGGASFYAERTRTAPALSDRAHVVRAVLHHADDLGTTSLDIETRPGTFAYRRFDAGTRALAETWCPAGESGVLDLGAGCGALGLYAALRLPAARVTLVDSNARAVGCARRNAERMGVAERTACLLRADLEDLPGVPGGHDLVLANPPYFGDFRIARSFVDTAHAALRRGGRALFVARNGAAGMAHADIVRDVFGVAETAVRNGYDIVTGVRG